MRPTPRRCSATWAPSRACRRSLDRGAIALQLAVDRPDLVHTLALLEPPLSGVPSAGAFFEKAGPALAAYGCGRPRGGDGGFLSVVCSLDWETCRTADRAARPRRRGAGDEGRRQLSSAATCRPSAHGSSGPTQAAAISQPVLSVLGTETEPLFVEGHAAARHAGSRRSRTARLRASPTCCTCSARSPSRRAWPSSLLATP